LSKNLNNSPKLFLDMILLNVNLDGITYMRKLEDPIQVAYGLNLIIGK
jgi:hypothetical protein